jgi:hypothetical protein
LSKTPLLLKRHWKAFDQILNPSSNLFSILIQIPQFSKFVWIAKWEVFAQSHYLIFGHKKSCNRLSFLLIWFLQVKWCSSPNKI